MHDARRAGQTNHLGGLRSVACQRLGAHHRLLRGGRGPGRIKVQVIGQADHDQLHLRIGTQGVHGRVLARDAMAPPKLLRPLVRTRVIRHDLRSGDVAQPVHVEVGHEARPEHSDPHHVAKRLAYGRIHFRRAQRSADRPGPDAELRADDVDGGDVGDEHSPAQLFSHRLEQEVTSRRHTPTDHDAVDAEQDGYVAHANAEIAPGRGQPFSCATVAGPGSLHRLRHRREPTRGDDRVGLRQRLEAAPVAAAAQCAVRDDGLMAELATRAVAAHIKGPAQDQPTAHTGAKRDAQHRVHATTGSKSVLGKGKCPCVVDQPRRRDHGRAHLCRNLNARPGARHVGYEPGRTCDWVVEAGHAHADRLDPTDSVDGITGQRDELFDDALLAPARIRRHLARVSDARQRSIAFEHDPLDVGPAEVKAEMRAGQATLEPGPADTALIVPPMSESTVVTVLGPIAPDQLGVTDAHDHLFLSTPALPGQEIDDADRAIEEVNAARRGWLQAIVEVTLTDTSADRVTTLVYARGVTAPAG